MSIVVRLEPAELRPDDELRGLTEQVRGDGAVVTFVGIARPQSTEGAGIDAVTLDHHPVQTQRSLDAIAAAATRRFDLGAVRIVHRVGHVTAGHPIVFAGASARHRRAAFDAVDYLMDRLKTDAIFWKQEEGPSGSTWIEATASDHEALERWS